MRSSRPLVSCTLLISMFVSLSNAGYAGSGDPLSYYQWGLFNNGRNEPISPNRHGVYGADSGAQAAWSLSKGSKKVVIAVIDDGMDLDHEDLGENLWVNEKELSGRPGVDDDGNGYIDDIHGYDFVHRDGDPRPDLYPKSWGVDRSRYFDHGTMVASVIGATHDNGRGIKGVMPHVSLMILKINGDSDDPNHNPYANFLDAIDYAVANGADVVNYSGGFGTLHEAPPYNLTYLEEVLENAMNKGVFFVTSANNYYLNIDSLPDLPSSLPQKRFKNLIVVGPHNALDQREEKSGYGKESVHLFAPGTNIKVAIPENKYSTVWGSSFASPHVAGAIGLYIAKYGRPRSVESFRDLLINSTTRSKAYVQKSISGGRLNIHNLLTKTVTRPIGPAEQQWRDIPVYRKWESAHPYSPGSTSERSFRVPGARYVRLVFSKIDLHIKKVFRKTQEADFLYIVDGDGKTVEYHAKAREDVTTVYVRGDTIKAKFVSRGDSKGAWGFRLQKIQAVF